MNIAERTIDIICPIYNAEQYIVDLDKSFRMQENANISNIKYILTESTDNSEKILNEINANYKKVKKQDFSHSKTREEAGFESNADIIVFVTQDVKIQDKNWLYYLTKDIQLEQDFQIENIKKQDIKNENQDNEKICKGNELKNNNNIDNNNQKENGRIVACYSRQISKYDNLEKYTREINYPEEEKVVSKDDIEKFGLKTFFFSDASAAIDRRAFKELNGYDGKKLTISEDMYFAYKVINNGYKIKYAAKSIVYHSHKFTLKELYKRYKETGKFFKENSYLDNFGTNNSGWELAKYVYKRAWKEHNFKVLFRWLPDMAIRYIGMKVGKK